MSDFFPFPKFVDKIILMCREINLKNGKKNKLIHIFIYIECQHIKYYGDMHNIYNNKMCIIIYFI